MNLIDLTPGVSIKIPLHAERSTVRKIERVVTHPSGAVIRFEGSPWVRRYYSYTELQERGAEVVS